MCDALKIKPYTRIKIIFCVLLIENLLKKSVVSTNWLAKDILHKDTVVSNTTQQSSINEDCY